MFKFGKVAYLRHVLVPNSLPSIVTGMRVSMGIAWMVIVAVEMLATGGGGGGPTLEAAGGALEPGDPGTAQRGDPHANLLTRTSLIANVSN